MRRHLLLLLLLLPSLAAAQPSSQGVLCANQGTQLNFAPEVNCGAGMTCTWSNGICTISGAGGGGTVTGTGTPPQVAVWDGATSLTGYPGLTFTAPTLTVSGATNAVSLSGSSAGDTVTITTTGPTVLGTNLEFVTAGTGSRLIYGDSFLQRNGFLTIKGDNSGIFMEDTSATGATSIQGARTLEFDSNGGSSAHIIMWSDTEAPGEGGSIWFEGELEPVSPSLKIKKVGGVEILNGALTDTLTVSTRTGTPATFATFDSGGKLVAGAAYSAPTGGTVTSIATTSPITGGTITSTGTIACATCNAMANNPYVVPGSAPAQGGIIGGGVATVSGAITALFSNNGLNQNNAITIPAGWWRGFYVNYAAAQATGATTTFSPLIASAAATPQHSGPKLSVTTGQAAGVYSEPLLYRVSNKSTLSFAAFSTTNVTGTLPTGWSSELVLDDGGLLLGAHPQTTVATSGTSYISPYCLAGGGTNCQKTTALAAGWPNPLGTVTVKNLCFTPSTTQDASGTFVLTVYVNGSATSVVATQTAGSATGLYCDLTNTASATTTQAIAIEVKNNATAGTTTLLGFTVEILPASGTTGVLGGGAIGAVASGSTTYYHPFMGTSNATETNVRVPMPRSGTMTNFCVQRSVGASVGTTTATIFKNGSSSGQLSITLGNATGPQCATGSVAIAASDTITMEVKNSVACTGGCPTLGGWSVDY